MYSKSKQLGSRSKVKKKLRKDKKKATRTAKPALMPLSKLDRFVWDITSLAFRVEDADKMGQVKCCTCGKSMYYYKSDAQLGHFISRRVKNTKFLRKNLATQDTACNIYRYGEQFKFSKFLDKKYGEGTAEEMYELSNCTTKFTRWDYKKVLLENSKTLLEQSKIKNLYDWKQGLAKWKLHFLDNLSTYTEDSTIMLGRYRT